MILYRPGQLAFVGIPKCGTMSISALAGTEPGFVKVGRMHARSPRLVPRGYRAVCFLRDPVDRTVSLFRGIITRSQTSGHTSWANASVRQSARIAKKFPTFEAFCRGLRDRRVSSFNLWHLGKPQAWWIDAQRDPLVLPFASLAGDLERLTGVPQPKHVNRSREPRPTVTEADRANIREWAARDYELLAQLDQLRDAHGEVR